MGVGGGAFLACGEAKCCTILVQSKSFRCNTYKKHRGLGGDFAFPYPPYFVTSSHQRTERELAAIMDSQFKRSPLSCNIAASAAPDGTSVKLVTACGDSPVGPAPTTPNRSTPSSAPSISAAISLTPRGPTATAAASRSSQKFFVPTPPKNFTSPRKFRPKIANGPAAAISPSTTAIR